MAGAAPIGLVIFDCDGVLVDSEEASCRLCAQAARDAGMAVADSDAVATFSGMALPLIQQMIERETGTDLGPHWADVMQARFVSAMKEGVEPMPGVHAMLEAVHRLGVPVRVASNSSMEEMVVKFAATGLDPHFEGRIHSARDMRVPKPRPDVYLHAARTQGIDPVRCLVLEDSDPGARAAVDAGMTCVMLREAHKPIPNWPGLIRIEKLSEFPAIVARMAGVEEQA